MGHGGRRGWDGSVTEVRLGLIGCGKVVEVFHLPALAVIPEIRVVALADMDAARLGRVGDLLGIDARRRYADYRRLLDDREVEAVSVSTPPGSHRPIVVAAASAGKHVICEKPMATTVADADAMIEAARRQRVQLSVHHNYLWFPENRTAHRLVRQGRLGQLVHTSINCLGLPYFGGDWRLYDPEASGGGILLDMLHLIYLTSLFFGAQPLRVDARVRRIREEPIRVEDFATVWLEYERGIGQMGMSWGMGWGGTQLMGTKGRLIYHYTHFTSVNYERPDHLRLITEEGEEAVEFPPALPFSEGPFRQFVAAVLDGRPLEVTGEDGRAAVEVALAAYESAALHTAVALPLAAVNPVYQRGIRGLTEIGAASREVLDLYGLSRPPR